VHRARSHDTAHENAIPPGNIPSHPLIAPNAAELIVTQDGLSELIAHLRESKNFAYDSEFIGELTYHPKLCVIQAASATRVSLIDPLAPIDLKPFWELICDASVEKIVHAGAQDIEPVVRHLDRAPQNVFDTQIAAGFAGMAYPVALSKLVLELTGAKLGKGLTFTHWDQRPLSAMQLRYAADDVRYLPAVRAAIGEKLRARGPHEAWARAECDTMCDAANYRFDGDTQYLRVRGSSGLHPQGLAILRELTIWRDGAAREHDLPPRAFLKDEILIDLARSPVRSFDKLSRVRGLPRPVEAKHGTTIVEATLRALSLPHDKMPSAKSIEPSPSERFRADALWAAAQTISAGKSVDPALVTNRQEIGEFYRAVTTGGPVDQLHLMTGWRREALGEPLMQLIAGKGKVQLEWRGGSLRAEL